MDRDNEAAIQSPSLSPHERLRHCRLRPTKGLISRRWVRALTLFEGLLRVHLEDLACGQQCTISLVCIWILQWARPSVDRAGVTWIRRRHPHPGWIVFRTSPTTASAPGQIGAIKMLPRIFRCSIKPPSFRTWGSKATGTSFTFVLTELFQRSRPQGLGRIVGPPAILLRKHDGIIAWRPGTLRHSHQETCGVAIQEMPVGGRPGARAGAAAEGEGCIEAWAGAEAEAGGGCRPYLMEVFEVKIPRMQMVSTEVMCKMLHDGAQSAVLIKNTHRGRGRGRVGVLIK
mmetsp:Transcript_30752/g.65108  ORF Transcript_30752/g.65108 Transcript_30752/m.65108 type:complete len:286 (-) Transcript_30752:37-894(-)